MTDGRGIGAGAGRLVVSEHRSERQRVRSAATSACARSRLVVSEHRSERQRVRSGASE